VFGILVSIILIFNVLFCSFIYIICINYSVVLLSVLSAYHSRVQDCIEGPIGVRALPETSTWNHRLRKERTTPFHITTTVTKTKTRQGQSRFPVIFWRGCTSGGYWTSPGRRTCGGVGWWTEGRTESFDVRGARLGALCASTSLRALRRTMWCCVACCSPYSCCQSSSLLRLLSSSYDSERQR